MPRLSTSKTLQINVLCLEIKYHFHEWKKYTIEIVKSKLFGDKNLTLEC